MHHRFQVRRTIAHAAGHRQRTLPEPRTLTCARTHCCCTCGLARDRRVVHVSTHSRACATRALARAFSLAGGHMRYQFSKSSARWLTRMATHSARGLNRVLLRVCRRKRCHTRGLAREYPRGQTRADARDARPGAVSDGRATSLSGSNALSLARPTTGSARGLDRALLRV